MIRKIVFGFIWFVVLFFVIYNVSAVLYVFITKGGLTGGFKESYQLGLEFRQAYFKIIGIAVFILALIGTISGIFPGTKKKIKKDTSQK